ncbi:MAG: RNA polymerase sigma factor [Acidimicrobiales bacterium]|jgi:RNA polymerase sigma factor (sigma-70 family)
MATRWLRRSEAASDGRSITDRLAFERCFEEQFPAVHRFVARRVGTALADDLAAETFATAFRRRQDFDPRKGNLRSWLFGIASNLLRNHWRAEQHQLELDARLAVDAELRNDPTLSDERLSASLVAPRIAAALAELVTEQREVLLLHAWADLRHDEIAAALGVPVGTVRSRLSRARAALRERLQGFDFELWLFTDEQTTSQEGTQRA